MSEPDLDEVGPVDSLVVEFPAGASNFTGEVVAEEDTVGTAAVVAHGVGRRRDRRDDRRDDRR